MKTKKYKNINRERDPEEEEAAETEGTDDEVIVLRDPLELFGLDIMLNILSNLDARSGVLSLLVCHAWNGVASSDRLWSSKCEELWLGKAHMPRLLQVRGLSRLAAYSLCIVDGKRSRITRDDLCDHVWEFHFNEAASKYWRRLDPYWNGAGSLMRRYFHPDGSQTADHGDQVWGGHECCYCTVTSLLENGKIREHYVRINRWPRMFVSRKKDWSWEMSSHLFCYSSIPDSDKAGGTGPLFPVSSIKLDYKESM
ncbi:uncharacterized protein LOC133712607 isoform X2 [Rosa rugosa]|uniref:uncharacterized protein LOC133712607 isoform X2 n=1 Tax=Rosa rugosa TaxID=74645 RepID=UPI002B4186A6|nr:uncharacterized protein LOC133712607 isoform X2 [Rosa rugosa]